MPASKSYQEIAQDTLPAASARAQHPRDASGFALFSKGAAGAAHVMAHRMLDEDRCVRGHRLLGAWLERHTGTGSDWVHLQWHMAVFELALGHWQAAFARFQCHILPAAITSEDALTDAPALLWRLALAARTPIALPWEPLRARALECMRRVSAPYVTLHHLLVLAGAGDLASLDRWLQTHAPRTDSCNDALVVRVAVALRAYTACEYGQAASGLAHVTPYISEVGGSRGQNELFKQLAQAARRKASAGDSLPVYLKAA